MRIRENEIYSVRPMRSAAPARAREVINSLTTNITDAVSSSANANNSRVSELRARVKNGSYKVDSEALSKKIVKDRLAGRQD